MRFSQYNFSDSLHANLDRLHFIRPTDIQFKTITPILNGEDVFAVAQTGTGKTGAFAIPIIQQLSKIKPFQNAPAALILVPTRELAEQILNVILDLAQNTGVKAISILGGVEQDDQIRQLKQGIHIAVATPGRVFDLRAQGYCDLNQLRFLVLDEADRMLDLGFGHDINAIHKLSQHKSRQTLFFSATINKKIKGLAYDIVREAIRIQLSPKDPVSKNVEHAFIRVDMDHKRFFLENMVVEYPDYKFVAFVRTQVRCERVVAAMERVGLKSEALHGGIPQKDRFAILERFAKGENKLLITTDVAARGIDIPDVDYVINYDLPDQAEQYVHRIGRTGRGEKKGQALAFVSPVEEKMLLEIQEYINYPVEELEINKHDYKAILSDSEDLTYNWQKLIDEANLEDGTEDRW